MDFAGNNYGLCVQNILGASLLNLEFFFFFLNYFLNCLIPQWTLIIYLQGVREGGAKSKIFSLEESDNTPKLWVPGFFGMSHF